MGNSIFGIGVSALNAAQDGLVTTGHNISNANTPGYSRQQTVQTTSPAQPSGAGFLGQGVQVSTVKRIYSAYLTQQLDTAQTQGSQLDSYYAQISQIDNLLGDPNAGLSSALNDFFTATQALAANPASMPSRQALLASATSLSSRFHSLDQQLTQMRAAVNGQVGDIVSTINADAQQIANLNQNIVTAQNAAGGQPPNDLLDQRDQLVAELNKQVQTTVVKQSDGSYNVFIGNGQPLVLGSQANQLADVASSADPQKTIVAYRSNGASIPLADSSLQGGALGGLLAFRSQSLDLAQNSLGRVAVGLADSFNAQHALGQDLNGTMGGAFFTAPQPTVIAASGNAGSAQVSATIADASQLSTSDYQLTYNGASGGTENYTLTRLSDGTTSAISFASGAYPYSTTVDGVKLTIPSGAAAQDSWLIEPTRNAARDIGIAITDPAKIAAASPIRTAAALSNAGDATISPGSVSSTASLPLAGTVTLTYDAASNQFSVSGASPSAGPFTYSSGGTISFNGLSFAISGTPANGDKFTIQANIGGVSDNRNALALAALQTQNTLGASSSTSANMTYQDAYASLVSQIGDQTRSIQVQQNAQQSLIQQTQQAQQSVSGVNLDEEAANLLRYQQAYQAAAKMLQIAGTVFQSILSLS